MVLLAGLGMACVTAFIEYLWTGRQAQRERKVGADIGWINCISYSLLFLCPWLIILTRSSG